MDANPLNNGLDEGSGGQELDMMDGTQNVYQILKHLGKESLV